MKNKIYSLSVILVFLAVVVFALACNRPERIKYSMKACLITVGGDITDNFDMQLQGTIQKKGRATYLNLDVALPDGFPYIFIADKSYGNVCYENWTSFPGDYATVGYTNARKVVGGNWSAWAINTEKEYFVAWFGKEFGQYLVASTDPIIKPEDILEHFTLFLDSVA